MTSPLRTKVRGLEIAYRAEGHGPAVMLLHAFPLNREMWEGQYAALRDVCHLITPDLPGFGGSQKTDGDYTLEEVADIMHDLAVSLGHERIILGGLSMGGYVALAYARRHGHTLRGLILADTKVGADSPEAREGRLTQIAQIESAGLKALSASFPGKVTAPATAIDQPEMLETLRHTIAANDPMAVTGALRAMAGRPGSEDVLATIKVPTLVIVGEADSTTPPAEAEKLAAGIHGAKLVRIPSAGHLSNLEKPAAFNQALVEFLRQFPD